MLAESFRQRAAEQRAIANALLEEADVMSKATKLVPAIVGHVNATMLEALADMVDYQQTKPVLDEAMERRKAILQRNNEMRLAAANGDWQRFDELAAGAGTTGGDAA